MYGRIYMITGPTKKIYIGQTTRPLLERWYEHAYDHRSRSEKSYLYAAMRKYGIQNFQIEELCTAGSKDQLSNLEKLFIILCKSAHKEFAYNLSWGDNGLLPNEETRIKLSLAQTGNTKWLGKKHTEETKSKMSDSAMGENNHFFGKKHSEAARQKMKGHISSFRGKHHSDETKQKFRLAHF